MVMRVVMRVAMRAAMKVATRVMLKSVKIQTSMQMDKSLETEMVIIARTIIGTQAGVVDMMMKTSSQMKCAAYVEAAVL